MEKRAMSGHRMMAQGIWLYPMPYNKRKGHPEGRTDGEEDDEQPPDDRGPGLGDAWLVVAPDEHARADHEGDKEVPAVGKRS